MELSEQAEIFDNILKHWLLQAGIKYSHRTSAEYLGVSQAKYSAWIKSGQRPVADDMRMLCREHEFSANWLLLGAGESLENRKNFPFDSKYVDICDTLHDTVLSINQPIHEIAAVGGMTTTELYDCIHTQMFPPILALSKWIIAYKMNANFILAQIGQPFLTEEQWHEQGPLDRVRDKRGDFKDFEREYEHEDDESNDDDFLEGRVEKISLETPIPQHVHAAAAPAYGSEKTSVIDDAIASGFVAQREYLKEVCKQLKEANAPDTMIQDAILRIVTNGIEQPIQSAAGNGE